MLLAVAVGSVRIPLPELVDALAAGGAGSGDVTGTILWEIRLPRVLLAALVGASLAVAGATYQGIFQNPLADPYLLGAASGASLGAAAAIVLGVGGLVGLSTAAVLPYAAFVSAALAVLLVLVMARRGGRIPLLSLILAGVVIGSTFSAATSFLMLVSPQQTAGVLAWLLGSFGRASWSSIAGIAPLLLVSFLACLLAARQLDLLQLGDEAAAQLGVRVETLKYTLIGFATLATAAAVSASGIIGFVGLIAPHAVRLAFGAGHRLLLPLAACAGATLTVVADLAARTVIAPAEVPIGVVTALIGGPFFLWLLRREGRA